MEGNSAASHTAVNAVQALGRGFDVNFDARLLYCKGVSGSRIVELSSELTRDLLLYDDVLVPHVSRDVIRSAEPGGRRSSGVCSFHEMVEHFNENANLSESFPLGSFNSAFNFTGLKQVDSASTKTLSTDGIFIPLVKLQLQRSPLLLKESVRMAVPANWDPPALASFIENFGTHVIMSVTIGGKDVIYVKQHSVSRLSTLEMKNYAEDVGNQRFSDPETHTRSGPMIIKDKAIDSGTYNSQGIYPQPTNVTYLAGKEDVTVIFRRRGGDDLEQNHSRWARTVRSSPDIIDMTFCPITALLEGIAGKEHLIRAINLYLEYKPALEELRYFLEFQIPRVWAPLNDRIPGHQRKEPVCPSLQFSMMGQKLYVSQEQVSVGRRPVTGLRLCLEGAKRNRLSVQVQHLQSLPKILGPHWEAHLAIGPTKWSGPEEQDSRWFEPLKWKKFSHVSTAPVESPDPLFSDPGMTGVTGAHAVTGAQLRVWDFGPRNVLYMNLLFSRLPGCTVRRSMWDHEAPRRRFLAGDGISGGNKLAKFVDSGEVSRGPEDRPGHWLVTGGKLGVDRGKISLTLKYSLLNY